MNRHDAMDAARPQRPDPSMPEYFEHLYNTGVGAPWDIGTAQPELVQAEARGDFVGKTVLELGCGTGDNAIHLARCGFNVVAVDFSPSAVSIAQTRIARSGVKQSAMHVQCQDVFHLHQEHVGMFDNVFDSALFHCIEADKHHQYISAVSPMVHDGGRFIVHCFSDHQNADWAGPQQVSEEHLRSCFSTASGWRVLNVRHTHYHGQPGRRCDGGHAFLLTALRLPTT